MSTRDSGVIDLFAIHKEEEARLTAAPSAPPPAVALDIGGGSLSDDDVEGYAAEQQRTRTRTKLIAGLVGSVALIGIMITAVALGAGKDAPKAVAAAEPPPPAVVAPPPPAVQPPAPVAAPPPTTKSKDEKPEYTPATAAAAYAASQGKKKGGAAKAPKAAPIGGGIKMQKVQSSGISN